MIQLFTTLYKENTVVLGGFYSNHKQTINVTTISKMQDKQIVEYGGSVYISSS